MDFVGRAGMSAFGHRTKQVPATAAGPLLSDTFTDFNRILTDHTPDIDFIGGGWVKFPTESSLLVRDNACATNNSSSEWAHNYNVIGVSDYDIEATITLRDPLELDSNGYTGVLTCPVDGNNFLMVVVHNSRISTNSHRFIIWERVGGSYNSRDVEFLPIFNANDYPLSGPIILSKRGSNISATVTLKGIDYSVQYPSALNSTIGRAGVSGKSSADSSNYNSTDDIQITAA